MDKDELIRHLCELVSHVGREVFHSQLEHDCFCGNKEAQLLRSGVPATMAGFQSVHPEVIAFIDNAVFTAIKARKG